MIYLRFGNVKFKTQLPKYPIRKKLRDLDQLALPDCQWLVLVLPTSHNSQKIRENHNTVAGRANLYLATALVILSYLRR